MTDFNPIAVTLRMMKALGELPVGKCGKPNGHAIRKLWFAAHNELMAGGVDKITSATMVEDTARPFRR